MFYALLALLATRQLGASRYSGAITAFDRELVKTGLFPREMSRALHLAFDRRQRYDHGEMIAITEETAAETLRDARVFVGAVKMHLRAAGHLEDARGRAQ
jgi:uncharacterized protein (UPF0332 family)